MTSSVSHIGLLQLDERGVTTHLARLVYLPGKQKPINIIITKIYHIIYRS